MALKTTVKAALRKVPGAVELNRRFVSTTTLNLVDAFPLFAPNSAGGYKALSGLTVQAIAQSFPFLQSLAKFAQGGEVAARDVTTFARNAAEREAAVALKVLFDRHGSDKANYHNYHHLYGAILAQREAVEAVFEIGLGTNNTDVASNMGEQGKPGASLRAFREFCPHAQVYGADIDRRVLFSEDRIKTFFIDQTDPASFAPILAELEPRFDLVIDDGLHSPNANFASLEFALQLVKPGGWAVIEDIAPVAQPVWHVVAALLPASRYESHLLVADGGLMFAVRRLA